MFADHHLQACSPRLEIAYDLSIFRAVGGLHKTASGLSSVRSGRLKTAPDLSMNVQSSPRNAICFADFSAGTRPILLSSRRFQSRQKLTHPPNPLDCTFQVTPDAFNKGLNHMNARHQQLRVYMPPYLVEALEKAARRNLSNVSVYTRQAVRTRLIEEGLLSETDEGQPATSPERMTA